ncbi:MAG TPA: SPOR domain-containing protein [Moraxellaceae bacterium]
MEKAVKQRLLGGVVLVAGAALFLPMLLDGSGAPLTVPPMPAAPAVPAVEAVAPKLEEQVQAADQAVDAAHAAPADAGHDVGQDVAADAAAVTEPAKPVVDAKLQAQGKLEDEKVAAQAKAAQAKLVQEKAAQEKAAQEKLAQAKAAAQEKAAQEKAAKAAAAQKQAQAGTAAKPAEAKPAAVALPEAWVVQVASLSSRDKADELAKKLRQKNYRAVVHQQGSVWKVVVGPELRKEVAESIKSRLAGDPDLKLSGWVQAYKP